MKIELKLYEKKILDGGWILEIKIWEMERNEDYPEGLKYSMVVIDPRTGQRVLMDNHKPKNHHFHLNDEEFTYEFKSIDGLFEDFHNLVKKYLGVIL